jgi:hypothetical protein
VKCVLGLFNLHATLVAHWALPSQILFLLMGLDYDFSNKNMPLSLHCGSCFTNDFSWKINDKEKWPTFLDPECFFLNLRTSMNRGSQSWQWGWRG